MVRLFGWMVPCECHRSAVEHAAKKTNQQRKRENVSPGLLYNHSNDLHTFINLSSPRMDQRSCQSQHRHRAAALIVVVVGSPLDTDHEHIAALDSGPPERLAVPRCVS